MRLGDVVQRQVDYARPEETLRIASERMRQRGVGCLVVVDADRRPIGVLTDRDIVLRAVAPGLDPETTVVSQVMTCHPHTIREGGTVAQALTEMSSVPCRRMPVVFQSGAVAGVVTLDDVIRDSLGGADLVRAVLDGQCPENVASVASF